jgi:hypothetical protein
MDGRLRFEIVVEVLVDLPALKETCEASGELMQEVIRGLIENSLSECILDHEALEYRLVSGPILKAP